MGADHAADPAGQPVVGGDADHHVEGEGDAQGGADRQGRVGLGHGDPHGGRRGDVGGAGVEGGQQRGAAHAHPEQAGGEHAEGAGEQGHAHREADQEAAGPPQVAQPAGRDQPHLEQEDRQRALEEVEEHLVQRLDAVGAGRPADCQAADQQHDALAGEHLVQHLAEARLGVAAPRQPDPDHQRRELQQHQEHRHVAFVFLAELAQVGGADREGDHADRAVVGCHRGRVGPGQPAQALQDGEGQQGQRGADGDDDQRRQQQVADRLARQLDAALQADGEQQEDAEGLVQHRRDLEVGPQQPGQQAEHEKQDDGFEGHDSGSAKVLMRRTIPVRDD